MKKTKGYVVLGVFVLTLLVGLLTPVPMSYVLLAYFIYFLLIILYYRDKVIGFLGNYHLATGHPEKAVRIYKWTIAHNTKNPTVYLNYGIILVKDGRAKEALEFLQKALTLKPSLLIEKNIMLTMGSCYWVMNDVDKAIEVLEGMRTKYDYVNVHVLTTLGFLYLIKNNLEKAMEYTDLAIEDSPQSGSAWDNRGQILYRQGDLDEAYAAFSKAVELKNDLVDSYYFLGRISEDKNEKAKAVEYYTKASQCAITALNTVTAQQIDERLKALS